MKSCNLLKKHCLGASSSITKLNGVAYTGDNRDENRSCCTTKSSNCSNYTKFIGSFLNILCRYCARGDKEKLGACSLRSFSGISCLQFDGQFGKADSEVDAGIN